MSIRSILPFYTFTLAIVLVPFGLAGCPGSNNNGPGDDRVTVPNVVGMTLTGAETAITDAGLIVGIVTRMYSDAVPAGEVMNQNPPAGRQVSGGSGVALVVSQDAASPTVPDLQGMTRAEAEDAIFDAGLTVGAITYEPSHSVDEGMVISQDPLAGTGVAPSTPVSFVVSAGPQEEPTAAFTMNHSSGNAPLIVQFEDRSTPGLGAITSWTWSFGDPASGAENNSAFQNPSHVFNDDGAYTVSLTVTTAQGDKTVTHDITVTPGAGEIVSQDVRVVDDIPTLSLDTSSGSDYSFIYTGNGVPPVEPGDILVGTEGGGYLRRVKTVKSWQTKANGAKSVPITTEFCSLNEAVIKGSLQLDGPIRFTAQDFAKSGAAVSKSDATRVELDGALLHNGNGVSASITTGAIDFAPEMDVQVELEDASLAYVKIAGAGVLTLDFTARVDARAVNIDTAGRDLIEPVTIAFSGMVGPVPVEGTATISFVGAVSVHAEDDFILDSGFSSSSVVTIGGEYVADGAPPLRNISDLSLDAVARGPEWSLNGTAVARVYVQPQLEVAFYSVPAPLLRLKPYAETSMDLLPPPARAELIAGLDAYLTGKIDILAAGTWELPVEGPSYALYQWTDEAGTPDLDASANSVSISPAAPGATVTISNVGEGTLSWTATSDNAAVTVSPGAFTGNSNAVTISTDNFSETYTARVTFTNAENAADSEAVTVYVESTGAGDDETVMLPGNIPLQMLWIEPGDFMMGRYPDEQDSYEWEDPQHQVVITHGFWLGKFELTKAQWTAVMGTTPWAGQEDVLDDPNSPAVNVSWNDARAFITELNGLTGMRFHLPSEAQWEYACRAGTATRFYWGDDPDYTVGNAYCWWRPNTYDVGEEYEHLVGLKLPNAFGLYDMSGNVKEWCEDDWLQDYDRAPADGSPWVDTVRSRYRVVRGGGWGSIPYQGCRSANRFAAEPTFSSNIGLRLARSLVDSGPPDLIVTTDTVELNASSPSATLTVSNAGGNTLSWTATSNKPAVTIIPSTFTGNSKVVTIATSNFDEDYVAQVTFTNDADTSDRSSVWVYVGGFTPPDLTVSTNSVSLNAMASSATVTVSNLGDGDLSWTAASDNAAVTATPNASAENSTEVTIAATDFSQSYAAHVSFTNAENAADAEVVTVNISTSSSGAMPGTSAPGTGGSSIVRDR